MKHLRSAALLALAFFCAEARAQTVVFSSIDSTTVTTHRRTLDVSGGVSGDLDIDMSVLQKGIPRMMGNADPLRFMRLLPGVSTGSEFDCGVHILGADNGHNDVSIDGVPIYGANHLLGFFSIFSPTHFRGMSFDQQSSSSRLGGTVRMHLPDTLCRVAEGDLTLGLMSSQGTVRVPTGRNSSLFLSARTSFMNTFYSSFMKMGVGSFGYHFDDFNVTWLWTPGPKDKVWLDAYHGGDDILIYKPDMVAEMASGWSNSMAAVHWSHAAASFRMEHVLYHSSYETVLELDQELVSGTMPSCIATSGYKGSAEVPLGEGVAFNADWSAAVNDVLPPLPLLSISEGSRSAEEQRGVETSLAAAFSGSFSGRWNAAAGVRGHFYLSPERRPYRGLSPYAKVSLNLYRCGVIGLRTGYQHQYFFQTGPTDLGFPIEYYLLCGDLCEPQTSLYSMLSYDLSFGRGMYSLSANAYVKRLGHQAEQRDVLFDFIDPSYDLSSSLLRGRGFNYGVNVMLTKQAGRFTGWMSYAYGRALRRFDGSHWFPSSHERLHELNLVGMWRSGKWDFGSTLVAASGNPYTPADYVYLESGVVMAHFRDYNSGRLRPYVRLDASATRELFSRRGRSLDMNLSLFNVLGRRNETGYHMRISDDWFEYAADSFFLRWVPSVSLDYRF